MFFDIENQLSSNQAFTGAATATTNSYQKQSAAQDISIGREMCLLIMPTVNAGAGSTVTIDAIQSAAADLSSPDVLASVSIIAANFVLGKRIVVPFPQGSMSKQFLGGRVTITGGTTTASCDVYLVPQDEVPVYKSFPKVVNVVV
jgi:hypothetical protein